MMPQSLTHRQVVSCQNLGPPYSPSSRGRRTIFVQLSNTCPRNNPSRESTLRNTTIFTYLHVCYAPFQNSHMQWCPHLRFLFLSLSLHRSMGEADGSKEHWARLHLCNSIARHPWTKSAYLDSSLWWNVSQEDFLSTTHRPLADTFWNCPDLSEFPGEHIQAAKLGSP